MVQITKKDFNQLRKELGLAFVGLGEYSATLEDPDVCQKHLFKMYEILKKYRPKGVVHCFSGSLEMAKEIINLNMYLGKGLDKDLEKIKKEKVDGTILFIDTLRSNKEKVLCDK